MKSYLKHKQLPDNEHDDVGIKTPELPKMVQAVTFKESKNTISSWNENTKSHQNSQRYQPETRTTWHPEKYLTLDCNMNVGTSIKLKQEFEQFASQSWFKVTVVTPHTKKIQTAKIAK